MSSWHEQDEFWLAMAPVLFTAGRLAKTASEIDQIEALLHLPPQALVLDLCCGIGRHSLELARRGFAVTGVDRTAGYLAEARCTAASEQLCAEFIREDIRQFCRPEGFDAAVNLFTSFGYFERPEDDQLVVQNLYRSLKPGGRLLIDTRGKEVLARSFQERIWWEEDGLTVLEEQQVLCDWSRIACRWILFKGSQRHEWTTSQRLYSGSELAGLLSSCGFADVRVHGDLGGAAYDQNAKRLVVIAEKPPNPKCPEA